MEIHPSVIKPLLNGCRVAVLSRTCRQAVEGWPSRLKCLEFESGAGEVARKLQWVAHHCPKLRYLALHTTFSTGGNLIEAIQAVAQGCPQLRHLDVSFNSVSDAAIQAVAQACPQLECLEVVGLQFLTDAAIHAVTQGCPQLKQLDMTQCAMLTESAIVSKACICGHLLSKA